MANFSQKMQDYKPTKGVWFWSCIACIALTMIVGFTAGGWVLGGTANTMEQQAANQARENLVASLCVDNFVNSPDAADQLVKLKDASSYEQDNFIEDGGWAKIKGLKDQIDGAADVCADRLVAMEGLPEAAAVQPADNKG